MTKIRCFISILYFVFGAQLAAPAQNSYRLFIKPVDKDSVFIYDTLTLPRQFTSRTACQEYIGELQAVLAGKGYITASLDEVRYDSTFAHLTLFTGEAYQWLSMDTRSIGDDLLAAAGWPPRGFSNQPVNFKSVKEGQEKMLNYLENNGHPFARAWLDSVQITGPYVAARMNLQKGPAYKIDSIRVFGEVKIANHFLQRYLDISNGSLYNREKLMRISKKIAELGYVQEEKASDLNFLGTGSVLNLYLKPKKSSQVNVLIGFLPNNDQLSNKRLLITGEANINLRNAFGNGEAIGLNWQQMQVKSQRLNFFYQHPYLLQSPVGLDLSFDMFRKDSSFLNINLQLGARYNVSSTQTGKLYIQRFQTISTPNTQNLLAFRKLPEEADVSAVNLGLDYEWNQTDYRFNPRKGYELQLITTVGTKKIKKNNAILELKDPGDPTYDFDRLYDTLKLKTYQFRIKAMAARYFPLGKQGTFRTAVNAGIFQSGNIFRNELFQIGGYKLLRGFDEESQYVSQYGVATAEYRYRTGLNSFFFVFADGGWAKNLAGGAAVNHTYIGTGLGMTFETKAGIFNLAWAVGKRDDTGFNLRQSKIHFGFVNYF
jgi:outer membrane protein assembly factor BamA